jgi:endonuclease/exonuclease/phosphatase family metal-dependent hydrolase
MWVYEIAQTEGGRIDRVIHFLREVKPDILGVQEALRWADHETGTGRIVAEQLDLNYVLGSSPLGDNHVALYTRFEILESETYGEPFTSALLRAELKLPDESVLNVFVVHLGPQRPPLDTPELDALINILGPYADEPTIVMGDFNLHSSLIGLEQQGFRLVASNSVDLIYVTQSVSRYPVGTCHVIEVDNSLMRSLSDHRPVMVEITIP